MTRELAVERVRDELRARIRRGVDSAVLVGATIVCVLQAASFVDSGRTRALISSLSYLALALCGAMGRFGRARWTPTAYLLCLVAGNVSTQVLFGPLLGIGAVCPCAIAIAFLFHAPAWRWALVAALTATPLALGALITLGGLPPPPPFQFAELLGWVRMLVAAAAGTIALATVVGYTVRQLVRARVELEQAHALELAARREREQIELEIGRARRADLIVEIAAEVGADIGAALAIVAARAEALARELDGDAARSCLADVVAAANTAGSTMRSLTVFAAAAPDADARCDAARTARELPSILRRMVPAKIALEIEADSAAWVPLAATDLARILTNLSLNARDAIADAGTIAVRVHRGPAHVVIEVRDDGVGMDAETRARVFQPFFTTKPVGRGTGLGLATAKILVARAGGEITLVSDVGRGTCFTIRLPLAVD